MISESSSREKVAPTILPDARGQASLIEAELSNSVAWLIRIRWLAAIGVILATWIVTTVFDLEVYSHVLLGIGAAILAYNSGFYWRNRLMEEAKAPASAYQQLVKWQVALDWMAMILLVHFSGGIESPVALFFIFHIIIVSIFFSPRAALASAVLASVLLAVNAGLEYAGMLPHAGVEGFLEAPLYRQGMYVAATLFFFASTSLIAAYLASSIERNLRQREQEVVQLSGQLHQTGLRLQTLNEAARTVNSTLELKEVLNRLVESTARVMGVQACSIRLLDKSGLNLEPVAIYGLSQAYLDKGPVSLASNLLAREVFSGKVVNLPDALNSPLLQYREEAQQEGIRAILSAPLLGKDGPFGVIRAYAMTPGCFDQQDEVFLVAMASQGSSAIENALAYQTIEELDQEKGRFIRMVTHELRSPVGVIRNLLSTLKAGYMGDLPGQGVDLLNRASRRLEYLQKLIDDLLDLAAGKTGVLAWGGDLETLLMERLVEQAVQRFEVTARQKDLNFRFDNSIGGQGVWIKVNREVFDMVLDNLISNAIKYTAPGGNVTVSIGVNEGVINILIEDTGIGIPAESMGQLFYEFYRAPNARALEPSGTGLGLAIVKEYVKRMNGHITVESRENQGSCFSVTLPAAPTPDIESADNQPRS